MGELEKGVTRELRKTKITKAIFGAIALAGLLSMALVAPNAVGALGKLGFLPQRRHQANKTLSRMIQKGYVRVEQKNGKNYVRLTEKGEHFARLMNIGKVAITRPARWDEKWRILIFDIAETRRTARYKIRKTLIALGFMRLQDSVWVFPYDCEDLMTVLKADLKIGKDVLYIIADKIEYDAPLRKHFDLPAT